MALNLNMLDLKVCRRFENETGNRAKLEREYIRLKCRLQNEVRRRQKAEAALANANGNPTVPETIDRGLHAARVLRDIVSNARDTRNTMHGVLNDADCDVLLYAAEMLES